MIPRSLAARNFFYYYNKLIGVKRRGNTKTKNDIHIQEIIEDEENTNAVLFYTRLLHITSIVSQQLESKCSIPFSFIYLRKIDLLWI